MFRFIDLAILDGVARRLADRTRSSGLNVLVSGIKSCFQLFNLKLGSQLGFHIMFWVGGGDKLMPRVRVLFIPICLLPALL